MKLLSLSGQGLCFLSLLFCSLLPSSDNPDVDAAFLAEVAAALASTDERAAATQSGLVLKGRLKPGSPGSALLHAALRGEVEGARKALEAGASLRAHTPRGRTALMKACTKGHHSVVELLLKEYAKKFGLTAPQEINAVDIYGNNALFYANLKRHTAIFDLMLHAGAEPTVQYEIDIDPIAAQGVAHKDLGDMLSARDQATILELFQELS